MYGTRTTHLLAVSAAEPGRAVPARCRPTVDVFSRRTHFDAGRLIAAFRRRSEWRRCFILVCVFIDAVKLDKIGEKVYSVSLSLSSLSLFTAHSS